MEGKVLYIIVLWTKHIKLLIDPARFLFNAGQTPKSWNKERLDDEHFKVLQYEADASKVFPTTEIKGGVAITIRDSSKEYGAIKIFTSHEELNTIIKRIARVHRGSGWTV